jgi:hypothetical protein
MDGFSRVQKGWVGKRKNEYKLFKCSCEKMGKL